MGKLLARRIVSPSGRGRGCGHKRGASPRAPLTVEYPELSSKTGKPLRAKALAFRTYESGPAGDPWRQLLAE